MRARRLTGATPAALLAVAAALLLPATAGARRDDLPAELYKPAGGSVLKDATRGIAVDFTCPVYHQYSYDELVTAPTEGYHVVLSSNGTVDANGLLVPEGRVAVREAVLLEDRAGHCTAADDDAGRGLVPPEPGTYWWQAYRDCATYLCPGGVEVSDVASVTIKATVCSADRAALQAARASLAQAQAALRRHRTASRRARVTRLTDRVATLRNRLRVVYDCRTAPADKGARPLSRR